MANRAGNLAADIPKLPHATVKGDWVDRAACAGMDSDLWFLDDHTGSYGEARAVCAACPVRVDCLDYAVENRIGHGLWGGLNPVQRRQLRRQAGHFQPAEWLWVVFLLVFVILGLRLLGMAT
jgi:WhiB family redox-sensing transcriptional regulator